MAPLVPDIDYLQQSSNGMYRTIQHTVAIYDAGRWRRFHFFIFQDRQKPLPKPSSIFESWDKIISDQSSIVESFKQ